MATLSLACVPAGAHTSTHNPQCPDSPTGHHLRQPARLVCLCCQCRLRLSAPAADIDITRIWRAFVSQSDWRRPEITAFVEAGSRETAARKIASAIAVVEYRKPEEISERIYNLSSAEELIAENISEDHAARLFECGWSGGEVIAWVSAPMVLTADPAPLLRAWARVVEGPS